MGPSAGIELSHRILRKGILAGGNDITDDVKLINGYPEQDMLADIRSETSSHGGGPYNVLKDLAAMRVGCPLSAAGLVGRPGRKRVTFTASSEIAVWQAGQKMSFRSLHFLRRLVAELDRGHFGLGADV
jgi:hypothetical protein